MHCLHYDRRKRLKESLAKNSLVENFHARYEYERLDLGIPATDWRALVRWELGRYRREKA